MGETVGAVAVLLLAMVGCITLVRWAAVRVLTLPAKAGLWLLPLTGHVEDVEYRVRAALAQCRREVVLLDIGADGETRALAEQVAAAFAGVRLAAPEGLDATFFQNT